MFKRLSTLLILALAFTAAASAPTPASACPMCRQAVESEEEENPNQIPQAYMFSILFMLAMPATLLSAFGIFFYRLSKRSRQMVPAVEGAGPHHMTPQHPPGNTGW